MTLYGKSIIMQNVLTLQSNKYAIISTEQKGKEDYNDKFTEKEISRFIKTTGIKSRYLSKGKQCASDLYQGKDRIYILG